MAKCKVCNKKIWWWQEAAELGYHQKCVEDEIVNRVKDNGK